MHKFSTRVEAISEELGRHDELGTTATEFIGHDEVGDRPDSRCNGEIPLPGPVDDATAVVSVSVAQPEDALLLESGTGSPLVTWMASAIELNADDWCFILSDDGYLHGQEVDSVDLIACDMAGGTSHWTHSGAMQ